MIQAISQGHIQDIFMNQVCLCVPRKVTTDFTLPPLPSTTKWLIRAVIFVRSANLAFFFYCVNFLGGVFMQEIVDLALKLKVGSISIFQDSLLSFVRN